MVAVLGLGAVNPFLPATWRDELFITLIVVAIPFVFSFTRSSRVDRFVGDLLYPIYVFHLMPPLVMGLPAAICSTLVGTVLIQFFIDRPFDRLRHAWFSRGSPKVQKAQQPSPSTV